MCVCLCVWGCYLDSPWQHWQWLQLRGWRWVTFWSCRVEKKNNQKAFLFKHTRVTPPDQMSPGGLLITELISQLPWTPNWVNSAIQYDWHLGTLHKNCWISHTVTEWVNLVQMTIPPTNSEKYQAGIVKCCKKNLLKQMSSRNVKNLRQSMSHTHTFTQRSKNRWSFHFHFQSPGREHTWSTSTLYSLHAAVPLTAVGSVSPLCVCVRSKSAAAAADAVRLYGVPSQLAVAYNCAEGCLSFRPVGGSNFPAAASSFSCSSPAHLVN